MFRYALVALVLTPAAIGGFIFFRSNGVALPSAALIVNHDQLAFGSVWAQRDFQRVITITNTTENDIEISRFITSCGCVDCKPAALRLAPYGSGEVTLTLNLEAAFSDPKTDPFSGTFGVQLVPVLGGKQPLKPGWAIHGKVHRSIVFEKNPLAVADELVRGRSLPPQSVKLHLREDVKWNEVVVTCDPAFATVAIKQPLQPMKHAEAELNFNPNLPAGLFSFPVKFSTSIPQEKAPTVLTITGTVRECVEAKPSILILPPKPLSEKGTGLVTLTAFDQTPFSVQRVETSGPEVVVSQTDHPQVYRIDVDYSMPGQNSATVFFFCKLPKEQRDAKVLCVIKYFAMGTK